MDDRGRVKLATPFKDFFDQLEEKTLFVTSTDRTIAQIYPIQNWRETEKFLDQFNDDPLAADNLAFTANELGAETEMDSQGRVLFSPELRRLLDMETQPLHLYWYRGHIEVLTEKVFLEKRTAAEAAPVADRTQLRVAGMK